MAIIDMKISNWIKICTPVFAIVTLCTAGYIEKIMTIGDCIVFFAAVIVAVGWFITGHLNRKNEISKERRNYRLEMLHSFIPVIHHLNDIDRNSFGSQDKIDEFVILVGKARSEFQLYGYEDEIDAYENFVKELESSENRNERLINCAISLHYCSKSNQK